MKKQIIKLIIFSWIAIICVSCRQDLSNDNNVNELRQKIDSLATVLNITKNKLHYIEKKKPSVFVSNAEGVNCAVILYEPFGLNIHLSHTRPSNNSTNYLCVPAAFTSRKTTLEGLFIENGKVINTDIAKSQAFCILLKDEVQILAYSDTFRVNSLIEKVEASKGNLFQQILLVKDSKLINCNLFGDKENTRRALIKFDDSYCIGESHRPITLREFQESLVTIGAVDAVYLDMGTWSEGWFKNDCGNIIRIGEFFSNTGKQTNWIFYSTD